MFAAGLVFAAAAPSRAAPNSINDCEKIEAADAYNQCLAQFGPVARTHGASAKDFGGDGAAAGGVVAAANPEASVPKEKRAAQGRQWRGHGRSYGHSHTHGRGYAHAYKGRSRHQYYGHNSGRHGRGSAYEAHRGVKRVAFNVISGHSRTR